MKIIKIDIISKTPNGEIVAQLWQSEKRAIVKKMDIQELKKIAQINNIKIKEVK